MKRAVFIDLQGTLGGEGTGDIRDFKLYPFSALAIKEINDHGMLAIVVTDQSHIHKEGLGITCFNDAIVGRSILLSPYKAGALPLQKTPDIFY